MVGSDMRGKVINFLGYVFALMYVLFLTTLFHYLSSEIWQYSMIGSICLISLVCGLVSESKRQYRTTYTERRMDILKNSQNVLDVETLGPPYCQKISFGEQKFFQACLVHLVAGWVMVLVLRVPGIYDKFFGCIPNLHLKWLGF